MTARRFGHRSFEARARYAIETSPDAEWKQKATAILDQAEGKRRKLVAMISDQTWPAETRSAAVSLLADVGGWDTPDVLLRVFADREPPLESREWAGRLLATLHESRCVPAVIEILQTDPDPLMREVAAYVLNWALDAEDLSTEPLRQVLRDRNEHPRVRGQAAEALGDLWDLVDSPPDGVVQDLIAGLQDLTAPVRFWCAFSLSKVAGDQVIPLLLALVDDRAMVSDWWTVGHEVSLSASWVLHRAGHLEEAEAVLRRVLEDDLSPRDGARMNMLRLEILETLARVLRDQGREAEARHYWEEAMTLEPVLLPEGLTLEALWEAGA